MFQGMKPQNHFLDRVWRVRVLEAKRVCCVTGQPYAVLARRWDTRGELWQKGSINEPLLRHWVETPSCSFGATFRLYPFNVLYPVLSLPVLAGYSPAGAPKTHGTSRTFSPGAFNTLKSQFFLNHPARYTEYIRIPNVAMVSKSFKWSINGWLNVLKRHAFCGSVSQFWFR